MKPLSSRKFGGGFQGLDGGGNYTHNRWYASLFYNGPGGTWMQGIDAGAVVHYAGQYWYDRDSTANRRDRKVREWTTLDLILNYTFSLPSARVQTEVAGYAKDRGDTTKQKEGKTASEFPTSTADYKQSRWKGWLDKTTLTVGIDNVFDSGPPFVAGATGASSNGETQGFDVASASIKGRFWYVALKKLF